MSKCECGEANHDALKYKEALTRFLTVLFSDEGYKQEYSAEVGLSSLGREDINRLNSGDFTVDEIDFIEAGGNGGPDNNFCCRVGKSHITLRGKAADKVLEIFERK